MKNLRIISGVVLMALVLLLYCFALFERVVLLFSLGTVIGFALGLALSVFPCLGLWIIVREVVLAWRVSRLERRLSDEEKNIYPDIARLSSGRLDRRAARAALEAYAQTAKTSPSPANYYRLAMVESASGQKRTARRLLNRAVNWRFDPLG